MTHNPAPHNARISTTKCNNLNDLPAEAKALLPSEDIIKRTLYNQRAKLFPQIPKRIEDLQLTGEWTITAAPKPRPFLFFDDGPDTASRIIGSGESLPLIASANTWLMNGNYAMAPL